MFAVCVLFKPLAVAVSVTFFVFDEPNFVRALELTVTPVSVLLL